MRALKKILTTLTLLASFLQVGAAYADVNDIESIDPWEGYNRAMFGFNDAIDRAVLKPVARTYHALTPDAVERGVSNVFSNLAEIRNIVNDVLQWKWREAGKDTGRFLVNSTVGIAGIFDIAGRIGLPPDEGEDFGQTLGHWGLSSGPYLVLPILGPSTLRDAGGIPVDWYSDPIHYIEDDETRWTILFVDTVQTRAGLLDVEELVSGDRYSFIRDAYLQRRAYLINGAPAEDDFGMEDSEYGDF